MGDVQDQRAQRYADCTYALIHAGIADGADAVFDQALTNGLAAIVADQWPTKLEDKRGVRSARCLLTVIQDECRTTEPVVRVLRGDRPEWVPSPDGGDDVVPTFTTVRVATLREGLDITQAIRHARERPREPAPALLTNTHLQALEELQHHPALRRCDILSPDRHQAAVLERDIAESCRAARYYASLGETERARREATDYDDDIYERLVDDSPADECPVCWNRSLIASHLDREIGEINVGTCVACSYTRTDEVAEDMAMIRALDRALSS